MAHLGPTLPIFSFPSLSSRKSNKLMFRLSGEVRYGSTETYPWPCRTAVLPAQVDFLPLLPNPRCCTCRLRYGVGSLSHSS